MESNDDTANAERILYNITPKALIDVIVEAYDQGKEMERECETRGLNIKHNQSLPKKNIKESAEKNQNEIETKNAKEQITSVDKLVSDISTAFCVSELAADQNETKENNEESEGGEGGAPREVGHNVFILAHQLAKYNKELSMLLKLKDSEALVYYSGHTAQIEIIREDRAMEQIVFPVPNICEYLTKETKQRIFLSTEKDEQNSKITGFFQELDTMWNEMKWQRKLRQSKWLYWFSAHMSLWSDISFNFAVLINLLVAIFYPFDKTINSIVFCCC
jgi:hypothetical protein